MLVTSLVNDYLKKANFNNNTMVQSVDVPVFYHNRLGTMADELLSLKWNNHKSTFADILSTLRDQEVFVDVTLACGGKLYPAHKFVLSTCSDYFREMFTKNPCKHPIVYMKDVSGKDLEALLDFMYRGEVNVPQVNLASLIKTAEGLQVKGLAVPDEPHINNYVRRSRDLSIPRHMDQSSLSPQPRKKRSREDYTPVAALNMMYSNMSQQQQQQETPNSPYDLSQKSSASSSVSQSDAVHNDRISVSPDQAPSSQHGGGINPPRPPSSNHGNPPLGHPTSSSTPATPSYLTNKECSPPELPRPSSVTPSEESAYTAHHYNRRTPLPSMRAHSAHSSLPSPSHQRDERAQEHRSSSEDALMKCNNDDDDNCQTILKEDRDPLPGPSGMHPPSGTEEDEDDGVTIKEDLTVDDEDYENEWSGSGAHCCGSDGGDTTHSGESGIHDSLFQHHCDASNSSLPFDPALDLSSKSRGDNGTMLSPRSHSAGPHPHLSGSLLLPPRPLWPQDGNIADEILTCPICNKRFPKKRKSNLQVHMRTHTGERPFKCAQCSRGFKQKAHLEKHQEKSCHVMSEYVPYPFFPKLG